MQKQQRNILTEAISIFQQLQQRRDELTREIDEIDQALSQFRGASSAGAFRKAPKGVIRRGVGQNGMPLREALFKVLANGARSKDQLLEDVQRIGYRFAATDPMNSLQAFLYGPGKKLFKRAEGKFSLANGVSASSGVKVKRTMSPEARKRIAAAQKKIWAERKKAA